MCPAAPADPLVVPFDNAAQRYEQYLTSPLGRLRDDLAWHWLQTALQAQPGTRESIDIGAGTGRLARRLAEIGYNVCLLDPSEQMLAIARQRAAGLPEAATARLSYHQAGVEALADAGNIRAYNLALLHTVIEYLPEPAAALATVAEALRDGGLLSIVFANRHAEPLRRAIVLRQSEAVRAALAAETFPERLFGVERRMFTAAEMRQQLASLGIEVMEERGIRVFADYLWDDAGSEDSLAQLFELEIAAGSLFPCRDIARYVHLLGRKLSG